MTKYLTLLLFISLPAFSGIILQKSAQSGMGIPENSFSKNCSVYSEGYASIKINRAGQKPEVYTRRISRQNILITQGLLQVARYGKIRNEGVSCDRGNRLLYGFVGSKRFIIDEDKDCVSHWVNTSRATSQLRSRSSSACGF